MPRKKVTHNNTFLKPKSEPQLFITKFSSQFHQSTSAEFTSIAVFEKNGLSYSLNSSRFSRGSALLVKADVMKASTSRAIKNCPSLHHCSILLCALLRVGVFLSQLHCWQRVIFINIFIHKGLSP